MIMVYNFGFVKDFMNFDSEDDFYFLQILQRRKDDQLGKVSPPDKPSKLIKVYSIRSVEHLMEKKEEIIEICNIFGARAQLHVNKRGFKKCAYATLNRLSDALYHEDFAKARDAYNSACGKSSNEDKTTKKWVIDIDADEIDATVDEYSKKCMDTVTDLKPNPGEDKVISSVASKNGAHIITRPFDLKEFKEVFPSIEIKKDSFTNLYIPG